MEQFTFTTEQTFIDRLNANCYYQNEGLGGEPWTARDIEPGNMRTYCYEWGRRECEKICCSCGEILSELEDWYDKDPLERKVDDLIATVCKQAEEIASLKARFGPFK